MKADGAMKWRAEGHILVEDETCETIADFFADDPKSHERCKLAATAPDKARVVVYVHGGLVQWVFLDKPVNVVVLDGDVDGCDEDELTNITFKNGKERVVFINQQPEINPEFVNNIFKEVDDAML